VGLSFPSKPLREAPGVTAALVQPWNELMASLRDYFGKVPRVYFADLMVRTGQTNQSAFPIEVSVPEGLVPKGVTVCPEPGRARNAVTHAGCILRLAPEQRGNHGALPHRPL
jgi:hypothetical protein